MIKVFRTFSATFSHSANSFNRNTSLVMFFPMVESSCQTATSSKVFEVPRLLFLLVLLSPSHLQRLSMSKGKSCPMERSW